MHKQLVNEASLDLTIRPDGPILIKSGETGGLDPTHPDMEFVRTIGDVFIPGSSLKGVIRAHAERIVRSLQPKLGAGRGACDPLKRTEACGNRLERDRGSGSEKYAQSCFICRLFGSTAVASHVRFADALPTGDVKIEERNGVAIDRVYGSVAVGPFNYEVVTQGTFRTRIVFRNFTLAQLALVGIAFRDLGEGRIGLGFGKSRGLGRVTVEWGRLELRYPLGSLRATPSPQALAGAGALVDDATRRSYGFPEQDQVALPAGMSFVDDGWGTPCLVAEGSDQVQSILRVATSRWRQEAKHG